MKKIKSYILYSLLSIQALCLLNIYIFSQTGLLSITKARSENQEINQHIIKLQKEMYAIEQDIDDWHTNPYVIEKIAREQLQLAKPDELVFIIQSKDSHV